MAGITFSGGAIPAGISDQDLTHCKRVICRRAASFILTHLSLEATYCAAYSGRRALLFSHCRPLRAFSRPDRVRAYRPGFGAASRPQYCCRVGKGRRVLPVQCRVCQPRRRCQTIVQVRRASRRARNPELKRRGTLGPCLFPRPPPTDKPGCPNGNSADKVVPDRRLAGFSHSPLCLPCPPGLRPESYAQ